MSHKLQDWSIGFVGLGLMGKPMCRNLAGAGARLTLWNRTRSVAESLDLPRQAIADSPADVARACPLIIVMVADTPALVQCLRGPDGLFAGLQPGALIIDMGTSSVPTTRELAAQARELGAEYIDAPVSGGEIGARDASLTIMAGGTEAAIERARPVFEVLGKSLTHVGEVGSGQVAKAANQVIVGLNIGAVAEALTLARRAGVDPARVRQALRGGFADSRILEVHGQRMLDGSFQPGGKILTQHKDMSQAIELAARYGLRLPATELTRDLYAELIEAGDGALDHSALIKAIDRPRDPD